jgi:hypothetical protein
MYDRNGVRLSLIHALPVAAKASGTLPGPVLALGGLQPDAFLDHERVVRRAQIITVLNGLARKSGDATLGLRMAAAACPA